MLSVIPSKVNKIFLHTGNILSLNEIKKLAGQNQTDEVVESLKITLSDWESKHSFENGSNTVKVFRSDVSSPTQLEERDSLKVSIKIFIAAPKKEFLQEAIDNVLLSLEVSHIDSLVIACRLDDNKILTELQTLWSVVEEYINIGKLVDVGVSDVETNVFISLYNWANIKPNIIQINLAVCCVVPPALQEFCKENNVQLLTHSDPLDILPTRLLNQVLGHKEEEIFTTNWLLRFLIHVKCRGVLSNKGYLVCMSRSLNNVEH